jgi:hypothetical protein
MTTFDPSGAQAAGDAPAGWAKLVDPWAGFALAHPPGWTVHNERGTIVVSEDPSNTVAAWIAAAPLAGATNLQDFAARYVATVHASDPSFEAAPGPASAPGSLLLRTHCRRGAAALEGRINMVARGDQVVIRGFQAPAGTPGADAPPRAAEMLAILNSFRTFAGQQRQMFREPKEGAFTAIVPAGWTVSGEVTRDRWTGMPSCAFTAQADTSGLTKVCVPGSTWTLYDKWLANRFMPNCARFMPAAKFAAEWLPKKLPMKDLRIETSEDWPELKPRLQAEVVGLGMDPRSVEITTARTTGTFTLAGTPVRERMFTATVRKLKGDANDLLNQAWFGLLQFYYHAPEGEFAALDGVLGAIARSFRIDPGWQQQQNAKAAQEQQIANMMFQQAMAGARQAQQNFINAQHHIWQNQAQVSQGIMQSFAYHNAAQDSAMHQWSNATFGVNDVINPDTGVVRRVDNSFDQYWATNDGTVIGGNWGTQPDPSWHHLEPIKL